MDILNHKVYSKIVIFGLTGSGKSTYAWHLHRKTGIPVYHLDKYFFKENWVERDYQHFLDDQQCFVNQNSWIIDGNNARSLEMRYHRADIVLFFDLPRWLCMWRMAKRAIVSDYHIDDMAPGCHKNITLPLLRYMWTFEKKVTGTVTELRQKYPKTPFIEINSNRDIMEFENKYLQHVAGYKA